MSRLSNDLFGSPNESNTIKKGSKNDPKIDDIQGNGNKW